MRNGILRVGLFLLGIALLAGCNNSGMTTNPAGANSTQVSLSVTDTPPPGVTVLAFEVTVTGATLSPGNVPLVNTPTQIEVKRLETDTAFLSALGVPAGTYTSISVSLANPELLIQNNSGSTLTVGGVACTTGSVCEFKPNVAGTVTFSGPPFPITLTANTPTGFLVDVNLNNIITGGASVDFSAAGALTVTQLTPLQGRLRDIDDLTGIVMNKDVTNNQFTLRTRQKDFLISVDSNTQFEEFNHASPPCAASPENFTCVVNGQVVKVDVRLMTAGTLLAHEVELEDDVNREVVEGVVVGIGTGTPPTQFNLAVIREDSLNSGTQVGMVVRVQLLSSTSFSVDNPNLNLSGLSFGSASDLMVGQVVGVRVQLFTPGTPPQITTDRVRLRSSRLTAQLSGAPSGSTFTLTNLPGLFTSNGIMQIQVQTSSQTDFDGVSGIGGLASGNTVSVRGPLFQTTGTPVLVAEKVRKR
jgi:hypothetical protein